MTLLLILIIILISSFFFFYFVKTRNVRNEVKAREKELMLVNEKLKEIDKDKREFIDVITHELNTPLAMVSGYLSMILEFPEEEVKSSVLNLAKKSFVATKRMSKIIEDLISSSEAIGEGKAQAIQIEELIEKTIEDFSEAAEERGLDLSFKLPKSIPLPLVAADPLSTRIILANLIDNAVKFTKQGRITVEAEPQKGSMFLKITDTGIGINKENQKRIFEKFFQVDSSHTREAGGTGVGLYIVKNLVEKQGGRVWVESRENGGSVFYLTLPLAS